MLDHPHPDLPPSRGKGSIKYPTARVLAWVVGVGVLAKSLIALSLVVFPLPIEILEKDYSTLSLDPAGKLLRISLSPSGKYRIRLHLDDFGEDLKKGFLLYEDKHFYRHPGINPWSLARSALCNLRHRRVRMGGSTLTMQIAKMMEPKPRTLRSKGIEIFRALQLEHRYSKRELFELYLNLIPMGGNMEGVGAASYLYFGKPARSLSFGESALLIGLPRSPNRYRPDLHADQARRQKMKIMSQIGPAFGLTAQEFRKNVVRPFPHKRYPNPYECPHLIVRTRSLGNPHVKHYTMDPRIQSLCEDLLRKTVKTLEPEGAYNGAIVVIDNATMKVLAYVGSPDFYDPAHGGQINGAAILRSPGSLLKPFLYAIGLERGLLTPRKLLYDVERNYDGYSPANFDRRFLGPIAAEEALARSLNVPAVNLEFELGQDGLEAFIRQARLVDEQRAKRAPGLSMVLGAYPMTLEELVSLYSVLANQGRLRRVVFFEEDVHDPNQGLVLLQPQTCYIMADMLSKLERPDLPQAWEFTSNRGRIAFKTGTSFGLRDAWSVGFNPRYTIGVWLGNVNAKSSSALVGMKAAAPLLVSIFNDLTRYGDSWFRRPDGVGQREVCALSGEPLAPFCKAKRMDYFLPGVSSNIACSVHQRIYVRKKDGAQVCRLCMDGPLKAYQEKIVEIWPPDIATFFRSRGKTDVLLPPHNPQCRIVLQEKDKGLKMRSPLPGGFYSVTGALSADAQKIPLMVQSRNSGNNVYWYVDNVLIGQGPPDQVFYVQPTPGLHRASVMDIRGHFDTAEFRVRRMF